MYSSHHASSFQTDGYIDWPEQVSFIYIDTQFNSRCAFNVTYSSQQFYIPVEHEDFHRSTMHPESFGSSLLPSHPAPSHFPNYDPNNVYQDGPENCPRWLPLLNNSNYAARTIAAAQTTEVCTSFVFINTCILTNDIHSLLLPPSEDHTPVKSKTFNGETAQALRDI